MSARAKLSIGLGACLAGGLLAAGCSDARPRVRYVPAGGSGHTSSGSSYDPRAGGVALAPGAVAAPGSGSVANPGSGAVANPGGGSTSNGPTPGPGGLSHVPLQPLPAPTTTISVGRGPLLAQTARGDVFEHLRDWEARDVRALDPRDGRIASDGLRDSRDLVAFYSRRQAGSLYLRVDLLDLRYGAELGGLDLVFLLGWGGAGATGLPLGLRETTAVPYGAALVVKDANDVALYDAAGAAAVTSGAGGLEVAFRSDLDAVEVGVAESHLRALGWAGQDLTFQVASLADGDRRAADAVLEVDLLDRRLDQVVREGWTAQRRAVLSPVLVGNRAALDASYLSDLCWSQTTTTGEGHPTGLRRTLESHTAHRLPVNVHLSGVLANAIGWASSPDPRADGPALLARVADLLDADPANGDGAFLPGLYVDNVMPYFEGAPNARFLALAAEVYRERLGVQQAGPVFWIPERVAKGTTLDEVRAAGFTHTVLDRTHLREWFGATVDDGRLHRINGVDCFVIDPTVSLFAESDGGPSAALRELLVARALDPDAQQAIVLAADWEEYAGHKGNPDVPDSYDRILQWLSQRPWIEVATLEDLAGRGWTPVDHGTHATLAVETYEWLRHACEESYDHWYYGHPLEDSFAALRPLIRHGRPHARPLGDVQTPGSLLGDAWARIQAAPAGGLRDLAEQAYAGALYRTAWHTEDQHDTTRLGNAYLHPDTTRDGISGFVLALATHNVGEAAIVARAASWAAAPPATPAVRTEDVDLDGEPEVVLMDERLLLVLERDGLRITAGFTRDPQTGEGYQVLGAPLSFPERSNEAGWEDPTMRAPRNSALKDVWLTGAGRDYVNDGGVATVSTTTAAVTFVSSDGRLEKTVALAGGGRAEVTYRLDPAGGTLYVRCGLAPNLRALALSGQQGLTESDDGATYRLAKAHAGKTVEVAVGYADPGHSARRNAQATQGHPASPRHTAFQHVIELAGDAPGFSFSIGASAR